MYTEQGAEKLPPTADTGRSVVGDSEIKSLCCRWCREVKHRSELLRCGSCLSVDYCSKACQKKDWGEHKGICNAINQLSAQDNCAEGGGDGADPGVFAAHLTPNEKQKIAKIIGRRCTAKGRLNGKKQKFYWTVVRKCQLSMQNSCRSTAREHQLRVFRTYLE